MDLPSGKHQHDPDFLRNINIKKIKGRLQVSYYIWLLSIKLFVFSILLVHLFSCRKLQLVKLQRTIDLILTQGLWRTEE